MAQFESQILFQEAIRKGIKSMTEHGLRREALVAVAEVLQDELSSNPSNQPIEHHDPLEVLMRVVVGVLDKGRRTAGEIQGDYISGKFRYAVRGLAIELEASAPSFKRAEQRHKIRIASLD